MPTWLLIACLVTFTFLCWIWKSDDYLNVFLKVWFGVLSLLLTCILFGIPL